MKPHEFAVCINNRGHEASLDVRKLYQVLPDTDAARHNQLRIVDESGEDYLYPATLFDLLALPDSVAERVLAAHAA